MTSTLRSIIGSVLLLISTMSLAFIMNHHTSGMGWMDFTSNQRYTLTDGTKGILEKLTRPLVAKLFFSQETIKELHTDQLMQFVRAHAYARDLLKAYERASGGKVKFEEYDPVNFSQAAEEAIDLGITVQPVTQTHTFAFGLAITSDTGAKQVIPFINVRDEGLFEYNVTKLIERVSQKSKKKIGILSGINVLGDNLSREMQRIMQAQGRSAKPKWNFATWLEYDYEIEAIEATVKSIPEGIDFLFVIQPKDFGDDILYAIDQYVLGGGKLIAFVDPMCEADVPDAPPGRQNQYAQFTHPRASDLNRLTSVWGVELQTGKVMVDHEIITIQQGMAFTLFDAKHDSFSKTEIITQSLDEGATVVTVHPGALKKVEGTTSQVLPLIQSTAMGGTRQFGMSERMQAQGDPALLWRVGDPAASDAAGQIGFEKANAAVAVAVRITGKFRSAFPDGLPGSSEPNGSDTDPDKTDPDTTDPDKTDPDKTDPDTTDPDKKDEEKAKPQHRKEAADENTVILFSDVDLISNMFIIDPNNMMQRLQGERSKNRAVLHNVLDYLAGSNDLINIRSRASARRPFDYIIDIRKKAQTASEKKQAEIQKEIEKFQSELTALQNNATGENRGIATAEALSREREANVNILKKRRELNDAKRKSSEDEESVKSMAMWFDTLGMPALVALIGLILWIFRVTKRSNQMREDMA